MDDDDDEFLQQMIAKTKSRKSLTKSLDVNLEKITALAAEISQHDNAKLERDHLKRKYQEEKESLDAELENSRQEVMRAKKIEEEKKIEKNRLFQEDSFVFLQNAVHECKTSCFVECVDVDVLHDKVQIKNWLSMIHAWNHSNRLVPFESEHYSQKFPMFPSNMDQVGCLVYYYACCYADISVSNYAYRVLLSCWLVPKNPHDYDISFSKTFLLDMESALTHRSPSLLFNISWNKMMHVFNHLGLPYNDEEYRVVKIPENGVADISYCISMAKMQNCINCICLLSWRMNIYPNEVNFPLLLQLFKGYLLLRLDWQVVNNAHGTEVEDYGRLLLKALSKFPEELSRVADVVVGMDINTFTINRFMQSISGAPEKTPTFSWNLCNVVAFRSVYKLFSVKCPTNIEYSLHNILDFLHQPEDSETNLVEFKDIKLAQRRLDTAESGVILRGVVTKNMSNERISDISKAFWLISFIVRVDFTQSSREDYFEFISWTRKSLSPLIESHLTLREHLMRLEVHHDVFQRIFV